MANKKKSTSTSSKKRTYNHSDTYYQKKAVETAAKYAKSNPKAFFIILLIFVLVIGLGVAGYFIYKNINKDTPSQESTTDIIEDPTSDPSTDPTTDPSVEPTPEPTPVVVEDGISINFLELGNWFTGDSTFIKAGDVDILIDAGSRKSSAKTISNFINTYCTDGTLEYVIATHAHQDHIAGFVGTNNEPGIFKSYQIGTLIDFALTNSSTDIYNDYIALRDECLASGKIAHHYTAAQCIVEEDGAQKEYTINDSIKMTILDQKFYRENSSDENNYSVCTLFTHGSNHYLFTGDLEKAGEKSLADLNELPHCQLFKGGHHGSYTANSDYLLSEITPETVCICCCCGSNEYSSNPDRYFPAQDAINNIAKYTDKIYVTTLSTSNTNKTYAPLNGTITFKCDDGVNYVVTGSNNSIILKETEWFKANRTWPEVTS